MADPVLDGTTLPCPIEYEETDEYLFSEQQMADGSIARDIVDASDKRTFRLKWNKLTPTQKGNIRTAWLSAFRTTAGVQYNDLGGLGYTVKADSEIRRLVFTRMATGTEYYECEIRLREV